MKPHALIPLAAALLVGCGPADEDGDGFNVEEDCDDTNADIYPDAPEVVGDGVDSDCDGEDPPHPFVGDWNLTSISMEYDGYDIFAQTTNSGTLKITEGLAATVDVTGTEDGYAIELDLTGTADPGDEVGDFDLEVNGTLVYDGDTYAVSGDWDCTTEGEEVECSGKANVDAYVIDAVLKFGK